MLLQNICSGIFVSRLPTPFFLFLLPLLAQLVGHQNMLTVPLQRVKVPPLGHLLAWVVTCDVLGGLANLIWVQRGCGLAAPHFETYLS